MNKKKDKRKSFFKAILFSLFTVSSLATILLAAFLTANYINSTVTLSTAFNQNLLSQTNYTIKQMNDSVRLLNQTFFGDKDIISFFYMKEPNSQISIRASKTIDRQLVTLPYIESVYLYNASLDTFFSSRTGEETKSSSFQDTTVRDLVTNPSFINSYDGIPISNQMANGRISSVSYFLFDIASSQNGLKNAVIINISPDYLTDSIRSMNHYQNETHTSFIVLDSVGNILSSALEPALNCDDTLHSDLYSLISGSDASNHFFKACGSRYLISSTMDNENQWHLISLVPSKIIFQDVISSTLLGTIIMIIVLLFCCFICLYIAKRLNNPIQAIARFMKGEEEDTPTSDLQGTEEFHLILSSFTSIQEQNREFDRMKRESDYSARQNYLNTLIMGSSMDSLAQTTQKLNDLNLSYIMEDSLCMAVFQLDNYDSFCTQNNPKELWVLRFAIVNIMEEIAGRYFSSNLSNYENDRFLILLSAPPETAYKAFREKTELMIKEIQENIAKYMNLSLTAAYSTLFKGLEHLPTMYKNMEISLQMRIKYGHGAIISPHMLDNMETGVYQFPQSKVDSLVSHINDGKYEQAQKIYKQISSQLFHYEYNEILSGAIHLSYSLYNVIQQKHPGKRDDCTKLLRDCLASLEKVEITSDIDALMYQYIEDLCHAAIADINENNQDNTEVITGHICQIIERDYPNPALCLSSIAEEIGLTPNYIGKIFKNTMQKSVSQYILDYRMNLLADYLDHTTLPLNTILDKIGIEKNNYFYTQFKKHFGVPLIEYKMKKNPS